jgi:hypothetical protein
MSNELKDKTIYQFILDMHWPSSLTWVNNGVLGIYIYNILVRGANYTIMILRTSRNNYNFVWIYIVHKKNIYIHDHLIGEEDQDFHLKLIFGF